MPIETHHTPQSAQWTWRADAPWRRVGALGATVALLTLFGPGFLALGTAEVVVSCRRAATLTCEADERFLLGLLHRRTLAQDVTGLEAEAAGDEGATRLALSTRLGPVPLSRWGSSTGTDGQRRLVRAFHARVAEPASAFVVRESMWSVFALFGAAATVVWALAAWELVRLPSHLRAPAMVRVDRHARRLHVRPRPAQAARQLPADWLVKVTTSRNPGGWLGAKLAEPARDDDGTLTLPPLHLALGLATGERLVVRNELGLGDDAVRDMARQLAAEAGCRHVELDEPRAAATF